MGRGRTVGRSGWGWVWPPWVGGAQASPRHKRFTAACGAETQPRPGRPSAVGRGRPIRECGQPRPLRAVGRDAPSWGCGQPQARCADAGYPPDRGPIAHWARAAAWDYGGLGSRRAGMTAGWDDGGSMAHGVPSGSAGRARDYGMSVGQVRGVRGGRGRSPRTSSHAEPCTSLRPTLLARPLTPDPFAVLSLRAGAVFGQLTGRSSRRRGSTRCR